MKYYLHDSNSFNDEKITELYIRFGYEGLGLFYTALEKFASQEKPIKTIVLKKQLDIGKRLEKCWNFLEEIGLIQSTNDESFNENILNFAGKYRIKNKKNAERVSQWRDKQEVTENVTHYTDECNADKVNKSKVNKSKFIIPDIQEVKAYFFELGNEIDAEKYYDYYSANGWKVGKNAMKDWKAAVRNWIKNAKTYNNGNNKKSSFELYQQHHAESDAFFAEYDRQFRPHVLGSEEKPKDERS